MKQTEINSIVSQSLGIDASQINDDLSMETCEHWDSLSHMELIAALEAALKIEFDFDLIAEMTSLKKIRAVLNDSGN